MTKKGKRAETKKAADGKDSTPGTAAAALAPYTRRHTARVAPPWNRRPDGADRDPPNRPAGAIALPVPVPPPCPAVAEPRTLYDPSPIRLPRRIGRLDDLFFSVELPELNSSASRGAISAAEFVTAISERLTSADLDGLVRLAPRMCEEQLAYTLGGLGVIVASAVKHERAESGDRQSMKALHAFPRIERTLLALAQVSGRVPRDDHDTTWGKGEVPQPWSFTGSDGERRFGDAVRRSEQDLGRAESFIDPLRSGTTSLEDSVEALNEAARWVDTYVSVQADLAARPFPGPFLAMREYLQPQIIAGITYPPPNATNALRWTSLDHGIGLLEAYFADIAAKRALLMPPLDRKEMKRSLALPTVCDRVADAIGAEPGHLAALSSAELQSRVHACRARVRKGIMAAAGLAKQIARLSSVHYAVIVKNLVDPTATLTAEERKAQPVNPEAGVSGRGLEHTRDLRDRRKRHPLVNLRIDKEDGK